MYSSASRSAKALRAPEGELKAPTPYFPRAWTSGWTSGPENSLYMADLGIKSPDRTRNLLTGSHGWQDHGAGRTTPHRQCGPSAQAVSSAHVETVHDAERSRSASTGSTRRRRRSHGLRPTARPATFGTGPHEGRDRSRTTRGAGRERAGNWQERWGGGMGQEDGAGSGAGARTGAVRRRGPFSSGSGAPAR